MTTARLSNKFKAGHIYFSPTRSGKVRMLEVVKVFNNSKTGERTSLIAKYDGKPEQRYEIKKGNGGYEYILPDKRFCTVIDTLEIIMDVEITDDMVSDVHEFNNSGCCTITVEGKEYKASWDHGTVKADPAIEKAFAEYIYG